MVRQLGTVIWYENPIVVINTRLVDMAPCGANFKPPGYYALFEAIRFKRHRQAMLLLEAGVDVDCRNGVGLTPLMYVVLHVDDERSRAKMVRLLLECEADANLVDWDGRTALMHASVLGQVEVVKLLLENKSTNIGLNDPDGNTALMLAAGSGRADIICLFLSIFRNDLAPLRLNHKNYLGMTVSQIAAHNGYDECVRLLTREAQFFPQSLHRFPDPKILDRQPTPTDMSENYPPSGFKKRHSAKKGGHIDPLVVEPSYKDMGTNTQMFFQASDFELKQSERTIRENETCLCEHENCHSTANRLKNQCNKSTQTVTKLCNSKWRPKTTKVLEPIRNNDNLSIHSRLHNMAVNFDMPKLPLAFNFSKSCPSEYSDHSTYSVKNAWSSEFDKSSTKSRPESEPNILPLIQSNSLLRPVKRDMAPSASRKHPLQVSNIPRFVMDPIAKETPHLLKNKNFDIRAS